MAIIFSELGLLRPERYLESTEGLIPVSLATSADLQRFSCIACLNLSGNLFTAILCCYLAIKLCYSCLDETFNLMDCTIWRQTNEPNFSCRDLIGNGRM